MWFNGIEGAIDKPGQIPWQIVVIYFALALAFAFYVGKKNRGLKAFKTIDLVYIGIGAAFSVVWEFFIGSFISQFVPRTPYIGIPFWGRMFITFVVAALVRKIGTGMLTLLIFNLLSDIFHYGFGGEPMYFVYESLTYGLFIDLMIAATGGKLFGIGVKSGGNGGGGLVLQPAVLAAVEGAALGALWALPYTIFWLGFFKPFILGSVVNWGYSLFLLTAYLPGDIIVGAVAGLVSLRIVKAVGQ